MKLKVEIKNKDCKLSLLPTVDITSGFNVVVGYGRDEVGILVNSITPKVPLGR